VTEADVKAVLLLWLKWCLYYRFSWNKGVHHAKCFAMFCCCFSVSVVRVPLPIFL